MAISGGNLTFNSPPDHETRDTYNVIVQAFDGNSTGTLAVVVTVTDVNEAPEFSDTTTTRTVEENSGANAIVGLPVAAEDPDSSDTLTYITQLDGCCVVHHRLERPDQDGLQPGRGYPGYALRDRGSTRWQCRRRKCLHND